MVLLAFNQDSSTSNFIDFSQCDRFKQELTTHNVTFRSNDSLFFSNSFSKHGCFNYQQLKHAFSLGQYTSTKQRSAK